MNRRTLLTVSVTTIVSAPLVAACAVMVARVGDEARFVTWPVMAFTALAGAVTLVGVLAGLAQPVRLAPGVLPALALSYFLPAAPFVIVVVVLVSLGVVAVVVRGVASGLAASTGALMVLFVLVQRPAVDCHDDGVTSNSGPWWLNDASSGSSSGSGTAAGTRFAGVVQVGEHHYRYACERSRLVSWNRTAAEPELHDVEPATPNPSSR